MSIHSQFRKFLASQVDQQDFQCKVEPFGFASKDLYENYEIRGKFNEAGIQTPSVSQQLADYNQIRDTSIAHTAD